MNFKKEKGNLYLDLHVLQSVPPSCLNRDETGSPKSCLYGGVDRARVSSQSWKRAMREYLIKEIPVEVGRGTRTKKVPLVFLKAIEEDTNLKELTQKTKEYLVNLILKAGESFFGKIDEKTRKKEESYKNEKTGKKEKRDIIMPINEWCVGSLVFLSEGDIEEVITYLSDLYLDGERFDKKKEEKDELEKKIKNKIKEVVGVLLELDIILFGRMVASNPKANVEATSQVAHSISTHKVDMEVDYFTAIDDLGGEEHAGAAMIGDVVFNSSTLYRYANLNLGEFISKYEGDLKVEEVVDLFINSFVKSIPTGKINTFANQTLPSSLVVSVRKDRPLNMVNAFEKPVWADEDGGYVEPSKERLVEEFKKNEQFAEPALIEFSVGLDGVGEHKGNIKELVESLNEFIKEQLQD